MNISLKCATIRFMDQILKLLIVQFKNIPSVILYKILITQILKDRIQDE